MIHAHKVALDPNTGQRKLLAQHAGYARFARNWGLAHFKRGLDNGIFWRGDQIQPDWNAAKDEAAPWCRALSQNPAKNALRALDRAIGNWLDPKLRARFPRFHRRRARVSYQADNGPGTVCVDGARVRLPERLRFAGSIRNVHVSRTAGRWHASFVVENGAAAPVEYEASLAIGVDVGVATLAVTSNGQAFANPKALSRAWRGFTRTSPTSATTPTPRRAARSSPWRCGRGARWWKASTSRGW